MNRTAWLRERREAVLSEYDAVASDYDEYSNDVQQLWVARLLTTCVRGDIVLDAPCGTGRYFPLVADAGLHVVGIDQSGGMLEQARQRRIADAVHHVGLQEMTFQAEFDAAMTIDAMENVPPEDWPRVLMNLHRAVRPGGHLYVTVEEHDVAKIDRAYRDLTVQGFPAVPGEVVRGGVTGYHYFPSHRQVLAWFDDAGWQLIDDEFVRENGWGYRHLLARQDPGTQS